MGENAQKIGKKLELLGIDLLGLFGWTEKMRDKEIKCTRSLHKNENGNSKRSHGVDLYMEYFDPYIGKKQGVFIECKNRNWNDITKKKIEYWINEEINLVECAKNNKELQDFYSEDADRNCALLLINCNDDKHQFTTFLKIKIQTHVLYCIIKASNQNHTKRDEFVSTAYYT